MTARPMHDRDAASDRGLSDTRSYVSAILNILEDAADEKLRLDATQKAVMNILEDADQEKARLAGTQRAVLNILDDAASERAHLDDTQRAVLNILDDFDMEKRKVEHTNAELHNEIEERVRTEAALRHATALAEEASNELEAFSYSVAHDLRAPLRSIDGFSHALLEDYGDRFDADGTRYLNHVRAASQEMAQLIDDLLDLSRVTLAEIQRKEVNLSEAAGAAMERIREAHPDREVEFVVEGGLVARADPRLLDVVLTNLLGNAWKFTGKRASARIEVGARTGEIPCVYFVRDDGAGFDEAYADKLFGVFQRLHAAHEFEGTGVGLATVRRIVRRHGGRIWAEAQVDRGATFYFTLEEGNA